MEQVVEKEVERQVAQLRQQDAMQWPPRRMSREQPQQHFAKDLGFGAWSSHDLGPVLASSCALEVLEAAWRQYPLPEESSEASHAGLKRTGRRSSLRSSSFMHLKAEEEGEGDRRGGSELCSCGA